VPMTNRNGRASSNATDGQRSGSGRFPRRLLALLAGACMLALAASPAAQASVSTLVAEGMEYESVSYGPSSQEVANIYMSANPNSPTVVLVHGGGWRKQMSLGKFASEAYRLREEGFTVFEINYDQDTAYTPAFPLEPSDVVTATRWAIANGPRYNADPNNVVLLGGSAGGNLVALAAEELDAAKAGTVNAVISLSGPTNFLTLMPMLETGQTFTDNFEVSVRRALGIPGESWYYSRSFATRWSPALAVPTENCPAWLIINSANELIPASQAEEMNANLVNAGCSASLIVLPGREHAFEYWRFVRPAVVNFIKAH
jgi:acetyl esterase/lipase